MAPTATRPIRPPNVVMRDAAPSDGAEVAWMSALVAEAEEDEEERVEVDMEEVALLSMLLESVAVAEEVPVDMAEESVMVLMLESVMEPVMEPVLMLMEALSVAVMEPLAELALLGAALLSLSTTKGGV